MLSPELAVALLFDVRDLQLVLLGASSYARADGLGSRVLATGAEFCHELCTVHTRISQKQVHSPSTWVDANFRAETLFAYGVSLYNDLTR